MSPSSSTNPSGRRRSSSSSSASFRTSGCVPEETKRAQNESKKRMDSRQFKTKNVDNDKYMEEDDEDDEKEKLKLLVVQIAVRAGILALAGLSLCFSTFFIPGVIPFLGGLFCGVSLIEPPPLPGKYSKKDENAYEHGTTKTSGKSYRKRDHTSPSIKKVLVNIIDLFF